MLFSMVAYLQENAMNGCKDFIKWKNENGAISFSKRTFLAYFLELAKKNKPTTLRAYILIVEKHVEL